MYSFGQTLAGTATDPKEKEQITQRLKELRWTLKVNSEAGAAFMKQALALLDVRIRLISVDQAGLSTQPSPNFTSSEEKGTITRPPEYSEALSNNLTEGLLPAFGEGVDLWPLDAGILSDFHHDSSDTLFQGIADYNWPG